MDVQALIPHHKFDLERAEAAIAAGYPAVAPILPELLEWLQDYNWPVAHVLAPFLVSIGAPLSPHICAILETDDYTWKYWMIGIIMKDSREVAAAFLSDLERLAYTPTEREVEEELNEQAYPTLQEHGWERTHQLSDNQPVAELKPLPVLSSSETLRPFGLCAGKFTVPADFDAALPDDVIAEFEGA